MKSISAAEWQTLPEQAQQELLDFFYFLKQKYDHQQDAQETRVFSNHSAQQVEDWQNPEEDEVWN